MVTRPKSIGCREHTRSAEWFSGRLDNSGPYFVKIEDVRVEKTWMHYFDLFAVQTAVAERAVEWVVKKLLGRVQKAGDYLRFLA